MPKGLFSLRKIIKDRSKFAKKSRRRFSLKANNSPMLRGLVLSKFNVEARQPNSAMRKCIKVQLFKNNTPIGAFCPKDGAIKHIQQHDQVLVQGIGGTLGKSKGDIPAICFKIIKVNNISLQQLVYSRKSRILS